MRIRLLQFAAVCLASLGCILAQPPPSPYAALTGVVLNDATGTPLRRAMVTLSTLDEPPLDAVTFTESNGAFGFTTIPPGKYKLHVDQDGFQHAWFGASTPQRPPGILTLAAGDVRYGITFRLRPLGSISGVVLDPEGDPVPGASIRLLEAAFERRRPAYKDAGFANTDDRGRYRLEDVPAGQYLVMAGQRYQAAALIQPEAAPGSEAGRKMYAVEFYSGASRLSAATPVPLPPGKDLDGIDFQLAAKAVAPLHGKIICPDPVPENTAVGISVYPQDLPGSQDAIGGGASSNDLTFQFPNLTAGPYVMAAALQTPQHYYRGVERFELPPGGAEVALRLERAIDLAGRVDFEGGPRPSASVRVTLVSGDTPRVDNTPPQVEVKPDGSFVVPNVAPGIWDIDVKPIPRGGYLKAMRLGDADVLTEDMVITAETRAPLRIVLSMRGAVVTGTVHVPPGVQRSARAAVLLAPNGRYEHVWSFYAVEPADDAGHFEFKGVTPGRYKLYAFEELEPSAYEDPGFLKPFDKVSEAFEVPEGGRVSRDAPLILRNTRPEPEE